MTKTDFLVLLKFPPEWLSLDMYPEDLFRQQLLGYIPGHENGAEHDRNGAFHWWLRRHPKKEQLRSLLLLAKLDPDLALGNDVRSYICRAAEFDFELESFDRQLFGIH